MPSSPPPGGWIIQLRRFAYCGGPCWTTPQHRQKPHFEEQPRDPSWTGQARFGEGPQENISNDVTTSGSVLNIIVAANAQRFDKGIVGNIVKSIFASSLNGSLDCDVEFEVTLSQREGGPPSD